MIILTCLFLFPLLLLIRVQWSNYFHGKTTMERYGRSGGVGQDLDAVQSRMLNSGIK
jgi:hypothetical protein